MVRTIIDGARMGGGRCPNGVQHTGIKFPSYCGRGGGGPKCTGAAGFTATLSNFSGENPVKHKEN